MSTRAVRVPAFPKLLIRLPPVSKHTESSFLPRICFAHYKPHQMRRSGRGKVKESRSVLWLRVDSREPGALGRRVQMGRLGMRTREGSGARHYSLKATEWLLNWWQFPYFLTEELSDLAGLTPFTFWAGSIADCPDKSSPFAKRDSVEHFQVFILIPKSR